MAHARPQLIAALTLLAGLSLSACASTEKTLESPSMHEALGTAERGAPTAPQPPNAGVQPSFGYQAPYMPLVVPPDVRRIWVPTHVNEEGNLIQGHWVFVPVKTWQWFVEHPVGGQGLGVTVAPDATPPPWPAPFQTGKRTMVPWVQEKPAPGAEPTPPVPAAPVPAPTPAAPSAPGSLAPVPR